VTAVVLRPVAYPQFAQRLLEVLGRYARLLDELVGFHRREHVGRFGECQFLLAACGADFSGDFQGMQGTRVEQHCARALILHTLVDSALGHDAADAGGSFGGVYF